LQAHLAGWISHGMGGFDPVIAARNLHLPEGHVIHAVVAVGRQGDPASLPEMLQAREHPNDRVALSDIARHGSFA
jgi:hypothetical protein